jgi:hypothetical protein
MMEFSPRISTAKEATASVAKPPTEISCAVAGTGANVIDPVQVPIFRLSIYQAAADA